MSGVLLVIAYALCAPAIALAIGFAAEGMNGLRGVIRALDWRT